MPRLSFTKDQISQVQTLLRIGWSFWAVRRYLKNEGLNISNGYLSKLKNTKNEEISTTNKREKRIGKLRKLKPEKLAVLKRLITSKNPPTQRSLAKRFKCSTFCIRYAIAKLGWRLVKKPKSHALTAKTTEKRKSRSRALYRRLCNERWRRYVTSDEAWVYLSDVGGQRSVQYISRDSKRSDAESLTHVANPKGVMVWAAISASGVSRPLFIEPGAKINATYYQERVLKPFFTRDPLWNDRLIFHQDSAPSHKAKSTLKWLDERKIKYVTPEEWMPSSPDCAPCDFFLWGYLKSQLNKRIPKTVAGLQKAIADEIKKIPQAMINNALRAWPKRCFLVSKARGGHIAKYIRC